MTNTNTIEFAKEYAGGHDSAAAQAWDRGPASEEPDIRTQAGCTTQDAAAVSYYRNVWQRLKKHRLAVFGGTVLLIEILLLLILPGALHLDPYTTDFTLGIYANPSAAHPLGTDSVGRDVLARVVYGGRISLLVGILSSLLSAAIGIPLGLMAGFRRGRWEAFVMRACDIFLSFPTNLVVMMLIAFVGSSVRNVILIMGVLGWTAFARQIYSRTLTIREMQYVESARAIGSRDSEILWRYVLPNAFAPCLIVLTLHVASAIITESSLSFLGVGIQPPTATWGNLMYDAKSISVLKDKPWIWVAPGLIIMITVLCINFIGDGLQDALDPKTDV